MCVVGIGGVGPWGAVGRARSGVGTMTLVDLDEVCVSIINRQLHALTETVGRAKVEVMAERIRAINPDCRITEEQRFFNAESAAELLAPKYDFVVDAIDSLANKVLLLAECRRRQLQVMACGGAGGRRDGTAVRMADLARVTHDRLLAEVRKKLRKGIRFAGGHGGAGGDVRVLGGGAGVPAAGWDGVRESGGGGWHAIELRGRVGVGDVCDGGVRVCGGGVCGGKDGVRRSDSAAPESSDVRRGQPAGIYNKLGPAFV